MKVCLQIPQAQNWNMTLYNTKTYNQRDSNIKKNSFFLSFIHCAIMKFSVKDFFSKCDQIRRKLRIWSHLLKKSLMENFIFSAVSFRLLVLCFAAAPVSKSVVFVRPHRYLFTFLEFENMFLNSLAA